MPLRVPSWWNTFSKKKLNGSCGEAQEVKRFNYVLHLKVGQNTHGKTKFSLSCAQHKLLVFVAKL